jgi:hypothetical protein
VQIEQPVGCRSSSTVHFHATLASVLGPTLIRDQVIQVRQPDPKYLLASIGVMEPFHREQFPLDGIMRLIQERAGHRHLGTFKDGIPTNGVSLLQTH